MMVIILVVMKNKHENLHCSSRGEPKSPKKQQEEERSDVEEAPVSKI
jgi:hypothetical protein